MGDLDRDTRATLVMVLHHHQPVGNFPEVFRETYDRCYRPTLELLDDFPGIHVSIHLTGPLLLWIEENEPGYIDRLVRMAQRGQVEVIGGGFYEPILAMLSERDARAQVDRMNRWMKDRLGHVSRGFWLAERVWQTDLPSRLAALGFGYAPVDDHHFLLAGMSPDEMNGYFRAGWLDSHIDLFPISRDLRYLIPFQLPEALLDYMDRNGRGGRVLTYADDAEKFGVWPETYKWVWEEGYLRSLFEQISRQSHWLRVASMAEIVSERGPSGQVVLPNASYEEMMEWALPARVGVRLKSLKKDLEKRGILADVQPYLHGGIFENFLVKYPDVARLYGRMLLVSRLVRDGEEESGGSHEALEGLIRAQGNDVYWHGLFGGIYLSNLRHEAYANLLHAEDALVREGNISLPYFRVEDFDNDGYEEIFILQERYSLWIAPGRGGSVTEIDDRKHFFHLTNTMTRQFETYHARVIEQDQDHPAGVIHSIHDLPSNLADLADIRYDPRPRRGFMDSIVPADISGDELDQGQRITRDLSGTVFRIVSRTQDIVRLETTLRFGEEALTVGKEYRLSPDAFSVVYRIAGDVNRKYQENGGDLLWMTEIPLTMLAGEEHGRTLFIPDQPASHLSWMEPGDTKDVFVFRGHDDWSKTAFSVSSSLPVRLVSRPIHSVSLSEKGVEKVYQGTLFFLLLPFEDLFGNGWTLTFSFDQEHRRNS